MNKTQKRIINIFSSIVLLAIFGLSIALTIRGFIENDKVSKILGIIASFVSPATLIGLLSKVAANKLHLKQVKNELEQAGIKNIEATTKETKKALNIYKIDGCTIIEKENTIIIKTPYERIDKLEHLKQLRHTLSYYNGEKRRELYK